MAAALTLRGAAAAAASALAVGMVGVATLAIFVLTFGWPGIALAHRVAALAGIALLVASGLWAYGRFASDARYTFPAVASLPLLGFVDGWRVDAGGACGCDPDAVFVAVSSLPLALLAHGLWRQRRDRRRRAAAAPE